MQDKKLYVLGAGGHAKVVISTIKMLGLNVSGIFDDDLSKRGMSIFDVPILGSLKELDDINGQFIIAIGDNKKRKDLFERYKNKEIISVIHPNAFVEPSVHIGVGTVVFAGAVVQINTYIGSNVILNTGCTIDHDCHIEDHCHIAPGVSVAGGVKIGKGAFIGIGSCIIPNIEVSEWSQIGAGSVVVNNIPPNVLVYGNPARVIKEINHD